MQCGNSTGSYLLYFVPKILMRKGKCRTVYLAPVRERFTVDGEKLSQYNEGRLQAHIDNKCAYCQKDLHDLRRIYCGSKCRRQFKIKYRYITNSWASTRWRALRRDHFLCVPCLKEGRRTWTREVDHIIEIADGGAEFDLSNTQSICRAHHLKKTMESRKLRALKKRTSEFSSRLPSQSR